MIRNYSFFLYYKLTISVGSAYVAWFTNIQDLIGHILHKVPAKFAAEFFTIQYLKVSKGKDPNETLAAKWFNFEFLAQNQWILRGSISQNDTQFSDQARNQQVSFFLS